MGDEKISVLVIEPKKRPYSKEVSLNLSSLEHEVGGKIEAIYPYEQPVAIICNEEGKLNGSELNRALRNKNGQICDIIAGTFLIVGADEDELDFTSISPEHMKQFKELFETPEMFMIINGKLFVFPAENERVPIDRRTEESRKG